MQPWRAGVSNARNSRFNPLRGSSSLQPRPNERALRAQAVSILYEVPRVCNEYGIARDDVVAQFQSSTRFLEFATWRPLAERCCFWRFNPLRGSSSLQRRNQKRLRQVRSFNPLRGSSSLQLHLPRFLAVYKHVSILYEVPRVCNLLAALLRPHNIRGFNPLRGSSSLQQKTASFVLNPNKFQSSTRFLEFATGL